MAVKRLKDDDGNVYEVDLPDEEEDDDDEEVDEEDTRDREWLRARRKEWESSQSSKKPKVRRVQSSGQKAPPKKAPNRRVLRIA
jgi:hypothetical protein